MSAPRRASLLALAAALLTAGSVTAQIREIPCPPIVVAPEVARLIGYRPGPGRGPTDMSYSASFQQPAARCGIRGNNLIVAMRIGIDVRRGPANLNRRADFAYFAAITDATGRVIGKEIFPADVPFGDRPGIRLIEELEQVIPMRGADPSAYKLYLGFQLSREQLRRNRSSIQNTNQKPPDE